MPHFAKSQSQDTSTYHLRLCFFYRAKSTRNNDNGRVGKGTKHREQKRADYTRIQNLSERKNEKARCM